MPHDISNMDDLIDVRDVIARFGELEALMEHWAPRDATEFGKIRRLLQELKGNGGDEQWRGDWYPITMIRDSYFKDYAKELAEDTGAITLNARWPNNCIDWDKAASELKMDYSSVEFDGVTYWYR